MKYNKTKLIASLLAGAALFTTSLTSQATETVHSGTNCQAANLAQANLMSWNKDGLTNNSFLELFVICPVDVDGNQWDATPSLRIDVTIWSPPSYPRSTGPQCFGRSGVPDTGTPATDDQTFVTQAFNVGTFQGGGANGDSDNASVTLNNLTNSDRRSAHLLCLLPANGGTLQSYHGSQL